MLLFSEFSITSAEQHHAEPRRVQLFLADIEPGRRKLKSCNMRSHRSYRTDEDIFICTIRLLHPRKRPSWRQILEEFNKHFSPPVSTPKNLENAFNKAMDPNNRTRRRDNRYRYRRVIEDLRNGIRRSEYKWITDRALYWRRIVFGEDGKFAEQYEEMRTLGTSHENENEGTAHLVSSKHMEARILGPC